MAVQTYNEYSLLPDVVELQDFDERTAPTRLKFARRILIDHWNDPSYVHDLVFYELGRTIAISERKFVTDELLMKVKATTVERFDFDALVTAITKLSSKGDLPSAVLLPIELFHDVVSLWNSSGSLIQYHPERITVAGTQMRLFWSNKYNPFQNAFVISKDFASWTASPSRAERLKVVFDQEKASNMRVTVEACFDYRVLKESAVEAFRITTLKPLDFP